MAFFLEYPLPVNYKGLQLDCGYRIDVLVENEIILELKSVDEIKGIHQAQLLTYMKLARIKQGFLIDFNVERLVEGLKSFVLWSLEIYHEGHEDQSMRRSRPSGLIAGPTT